MKTILLPAIRPWPVGYAAFSGGDDFAVSGDGATWPQSQVSMNVGGLSVAGADNTPLVFDWAAGVWLLGTGNVRSTDAAGTSWVSWPGPNVGGFGTINVMCYDFQKDRLVAIDTAGVFAYAPSTYTSSWTSIGTIPAVWKFMDVGYVGGNTIIGLGSSSGTRYSLDGGSTWGFVGGATGDAGSGLCYNAFTNSWFNWESTGQINECTDITVGSCFLFTGNTFSTGNTCGLVCNPDTGVMIAADRVQSRRYWRFTPPGTWTLFNTAGTGLPLQSIGSVIYDRSTARWIMGIDDGSVYISINDGLSWTVQNGGQRINDGAQFFSSLQHLGYAQRHLQTHVVP